MATRSRLTTVAYKAAILTAVAVLLACAGGIEASAAKLNSGVKGGPGGAAKAPPNKVVRDHREPHGPSWGPRYPTEPKVRDHRTKVIVRDHRGKHRPAGQTK